MSCYMYNYTFYFYFIFFTKLLNIFECISVGGQQISCYCSYLQFHRFQLLLFGHL